MRRSVLALPALWAVLAGGCDGTLRDGEGWGACQLPARACGSGELCVDGRCTAREPEAGDGWQQRADGFDAVSMLEGSSLSIDAAHGQALSAAFGGSAHTPLAVARYRGLFPAATAGRVQGTLRLDVDEPFTGSVTFLTLRTRAGETLAALSLGENELHLFVSADVLQPAVVINGLDLAAFPGVRALLVAGRENTLAFEWSQSEYVRIELNGDRLFELGMEPLDAPAAAQVAEVELGVSDYQGAMDALGFTFHGWELGFPAR
jgi:hypothetical protein